MDETLTIVVVAVGAALIGFFLPEITASADDHVLFDTSETAIVIDEKPFNILDHSANIVPDKANYDIVVEQDNTTVLLTIYGNVDNVCLTDIKTFVGDALDGDISKSTRVIQDDLTDMDTSAERCDFDVVSVVVFTTTNAE